MSVKTQQKRGGGLGAYNKEEFSFTVREDLNQIDTTIEQLWLKGKNSLVQLSPNCKTGR